MSTTYELMDSLGETDAAKRDNSIENVVEATFDSQQVHDLARNSLDFLAALALPTIYRYAFPAIFISAWNWLIENVFKIRAFPQLALGLPRGFGKTFVIKLFILFCILFTSKRFILVISEVEDKAKMILSDVMDMLNESNIKKVFGDWKIGVEIDRQDLKVFGFRGRNIILMAAGAGTGIRGITLKNERPDVMIFDDIQSREAAESQVQSEALEKWLVGTAMKAKSPHGCMFLFIANMYPTKWSILRHLKKNATWMKFIVGGILENGESLWEELQPIEQLIQEMQNDLAMGHPEIFFAEVLNDENAASNNLIDLSKLPIVPYDKTDIAAGNFVIIDPSGDKAKSDDVAIGYFEVFNGYPVMRKVIEEKLSPGETIRKAINFCLDHNCRLVVIESVAYQYTLNYWARFICEQMGIQGIEFVEIYPGSIHKNTRIMSMLKAYGAGEFFVDDDCKPAIHLQITQWNPLKRDNTDGLLDLLTYCTRVLEMYGEYIVSLSVIQSQEYSASKVLEFNSPF